MEFLLISFLRRKPVVSTLIVTLRARTFKKMFWFVISVYSLTTVTVFPLSIYHRWQIENPGRCSARCGLGYQSRVVKCLRVHNDRWGEVLDKHCPSKTKPPLFVRCNGTCEGTKWVYSEWSKVSVVAVKRQVLLYFTHPLMRIE